MKKILKKLHLYLALIFCLPLIVQGLSGSAMVFRNEISDFILRKNYEFAQGEIRSASEIISAAKKSDEEKITFARFPHKPAQPAVVRLADKENPKLSRDIFIDPVSLQIIKTENPTQGFFYFAKKLHTNLLIDGPWGRNFIGVYGFIFLFMALSGIILWWPKLKNFAREIKFNFKLNGVAIHRNIHKVLGFWTWIIIIVTSFTGIYLAFPEPTASVINAVFQNKNPKQNLKEIKITPIETSTKFNLENALKLSQAEIPDAQLLTIIFSQKPTQPYRFNFGEKNYERGEPMISVLFDQMQQKIITIRNPADFNSAEKIIAWQHPIHAGEGLGIIWQILIFITGFLPLVFTITGIKMWWKRK